MLGIVGFGFAYLGFEIFGILGSGFAYLGFFLFNYFEIYGFGL